MYRLDNIMTRRSVRHYTGAPVPVVALEKLVRAGMSAPSSQDTRHFRFIIVNDPELIRALGTSLIYSKMLLTAKHAIVVASDVTVAYGGRETEYWVQDCSAAAENILIAANTLGWGACWTAAYPRPERMKLVKDVLLLPEQVLPLCVIAVGWPSGIEKPRDKFNPNHVHYNTWREQNGPIG